METEKIGSGGQPRNGVREKPAFPPPAEAVMAALERIEGSGAFSKAARHKRLLRYLVEAAVEGRADGLKEYTIAVEVFERATYDPQADSQVRVEIRKLRDRLERYYAEAGEAERVVITIPKGGYRATFEERVAGREPVVESAPMVVVEQRKRLPVRLTILVAVALAVLGGTAWFLSSRHVTRPSVQPVIAVLPFEDLSADKDQGYFCAGMTEQLISDLSRLQIFRVLPRGSVSNFKRPGGDPKQIGKELGAQALVEGSVRKEGDHLRVSVRLVETREGFQLWAETYDRRAGSVLDIQQEIAGSVAKAFHFDLSDMRRALTRQRTQVPEAYLQYLKAAYQFANSPEESVEVYKAALTADPQYALAWAGLASAWNRLAEWEMEPLEKAGPEALAVAEKAVSLDSELAEAQHALGVARLFFRRDWKASEEALRKAMELDPSNGDHRWDYARLILTPRRRFSESTELMRRAISLEPYRVALHDHLAGNFVKAGQLAEARAALLVVRKMAATAPSPMIVEGMAAASAGDYAAAESVLREALALQHSSRAMGHLGFVLAKSGRVNEARRVLAELDARKGLGAQLESAAVLAGLGERERAVVKLQGAVKAFSIQALWIDVDYRLEGLRGDSRFGAMLKELGLR